LESSLKMLPKRPHSSILSNHGTLSHGTTPLLDDWGLSPYGGTLPHSNSRFHSTRWMLTWFPRTIHIHSVLSKCQPICIYDNLVILLIKWGAVIRYYNSIACPVLHAWPAPL
jgi:hypothetical protein